MVQGAVKGGMMQAKYSHSDPKAAMKKPALDSQKKMATEKKSTPAVNKQDNKYGSWGPVYKNKEHFVNMHIC